MFFVIYTGIWLAITVLAGALGFLVGKLPIADASPFPWVVHRSCAPSLLPGDPDLAERWPNTRHHGYR
jgi:hypothetical protein